MDDRAGFSISKPSYRDANDVVKSRIPRWILLGGCLSVLVCLFLWITAAGVWIYVLKNSNALENTPDSALPSPNLPPDMGNAGPPGMPVNGRFVSAQGGFSYVPPEGWMAYHVPGLKYLIVSGPMKIGDAPNINAADEEFAGSLEDYIKVNRANLQLIMEEFRIVKQEEFLTADGLRGSRVVAEVKQLGRNHRQTYYFFENGNKKYIAVCTTKSEGGEQLDPVFEASMKTFRIER